MEIILQITGMLLVPTIVPPHPSGFILRSSSRHDRTKMLCSLDQQIPSISTRIFSKGMKKVIEVEVEEGNEEGEEEVIFNNKISLFDGSLTMPERQNQVKTHHEKHSLSDIMNTSKSKTGKRQLMEKTSKESVQPSQKKVSRQRTESTKSIQSASSDEYPLPDSKDFIGMSAICRNAGATVSGLTSLRAKILPSSVVSMALLWTDLSSSHSSSTVKYCTPSSSCNKWFCCCGRQVRAAQSIKPVLGVVLVLKTEHSTHNEEKDCEDEAYFVPLTCSEAERIEASASQAAETEKMSFLTDIPSLRCQTTLTERLNLLFEILTGVHSTVVFNNQLTFMVFLTLLPSLFDQSKTSLNVFDPRIAAYVIQSDIANEDLELPALCRSWPEKQKN